MSRVQGDELLCWTDLESENAESIAKTKERERRRRRGARESKSRRVSKTSGQSWASTRYPYCMLHAACSSPAAADFVNAVAFPAARPPPASVFHAFTRKDQQRDGNRNDKFATAQTLIAAETETVEFMSTNQDKDPNNIDYSCQYMPLQNLSSWA